MIRRRFSNTESETYMTIEAIEDIEVILPRYSWYSTDRCMWHIGTRNITVNKGQLLSIKDNVSVKYGQIIINGRCNLLGNCMSLIYGDDFSNYLEVPEDVFDRTFMANAGIEKVSKGFLPATKLAKNCYAGMFSDCTSLKIAPELPATTLADYCYSSMFNGCTNLTTAPALPATTLASCCYQNMFSNCTSLKTAPTLPATTLTYSCYTGMFGKCTSLTTSPKLPATTLTQDCYSSMFQGCTSLMMAPELPATTLTNYCYRYMFQNCTKLNYIKMLATDISASSCLFGWTLGVASAGTFVKNKNATWDVTGPSGIPEGWIVQNATS